MRRFGDSNSSAIVEPVVRALVNKGITLGRLNRSDEEIEGIRRGSETLRGQQLLRDYRAGGESTILTRASRWVRLNRSDEEIEVYDKVVRRFGDSNSSAIIEQVASTILQGHHAGSVEPPR